MPTADARVRSPAAAGRFYDDDPDRCRADASRLCRAVAPGGLPDVLRGAMVPHAGWVCSGRVAGLTLATLARRSAARLFLITGSVHTLALDHPATDTADAWSTPLGPVPVDAALREAVNALDGFAPLDRAHALEHSLEVQLPLLLTACARDVAIVPCMIPPHRAAVSWGEALGVLLRDWTEPVAIVASSDLTHYGPDYRFTPRGADDAGRRWAHDVNDRRLLALLERLAAEEIVAETRDHHNACGGGAIAATVAACRAMGATRGWVLDQTDSSRELGPRGGGGLSSVGYAGVAFG